MILWTEEFFVNGNSGITLCNLSTHKEGCGSIVMGQGVQASLSHIVRSCANKHSSWWDSSAGNGACSVKPATRAWFPEPM